MPKSKFRELRNRANQILKSCQEQKKVSNRTMSQIIQELTLHQIELEIQNEDLIKSQAELEESKNKYIELYDLAPVGYFSFDTNGLIIEVNQAGCILLGLKKSALINRCFSRYILPEFQMLFSEHRRQAFKTKSLQSFELKLIRWNQPSFYASLECKAIENQHTGQTQLLAFVTDITARKKSDNSLHYSRIKLASIDRLRSINELVYGMAQEQSNSLTLINNYLLGCIKRLESKNYELDDILQALNRIVIETQVLAELNINRKNLTSKSVFHYVTADINSLIKQTILLLNHEVEDFPITIQYEELNTNPLIKLDIFHIQQAILNLARNAIEAMRDSKTQEPKLLIGINESQKNMVEVTLFDNGPGITQQNISKLFEPHFTTKPYGIGLGLTVTRAIIEKHGGQMIALVNPSGGACFGFTLPYS